MTTRQDARARRLTPKGEATRARLIRIAAEVFAEEGYSAVSMRDIASRSGLSSGAIYGSFKGKTELLAEAVDATIAYGAIGPELRVHSPGKSVRVILGSGFGLEGVGVTVNNADGKNLTRKAGGVEGLWLLEGGAQFRLGPRMFIESDLFFDFSGDGSIKDNDNSQRYFAGSPVTRAGLRAFFGLAL